MRRAVRKEISPPTHWLPSSQAFIDATLAGLGWATNPVMMAKPYLQAGTLVELSPRRPLPVPLYWQCARSVAPRLTKLTEKIASIAQKALSQQAK